MLLNRTWSHMSLVLRWRNLALLYPITTSRMICRNSNIIGKGTRGIRTPASSPAGVFGPLTSSVKCGESCLAPPPWPRWQGTEIPESKWEHLPREFDGEAGSGEGEKPPFSECVLNCSHMAQNFQDYFSSKYSAFSLPLKINCTIQAICTSD